jgi:hypothetical protein
VILGAFSMGFCNDVYKNINIEISLHKDTVDSKRNGVLKFNVVLINKFEKPVAVLNRKAVTSFNEPSYLWNTEIFFNDSVRMVYPQNFLNKAKIPSSKDYILLLPNKGFNFSFEIDFNTLALKVENFGKQNNYYGEYSICVYYHDNYHKHRDAVVGSYKSNVLKLNYQ